MVFASVLDDTTTRISLDSQNQTVGVYLRRWLEGPLKDSVAPKTYADYSWIACKHLIPEIGCIELGKLTA